MLKYKTVHKHDTCVLELLKWDSLFPAPTEIDFHFYNNIRQHRDKTIHFVYFVGYVSLVLNHYPLDSQLTYLFFQ